MSTASLRPPRSSRPGATRRPPTPPRPATTRRSRRRIPTAGPRSTLALLLALAVAGGPTVPAALADRGGGSGGDEARVRTTARCGHGARTRLELRARDGRIRLDWDLERARAGERWRVVVVQEASVAGRRVVRLGRSGGAEVRLTLRDLEGADRVEVRAGGPRGTTCAVAATLRG